MAGNYYRLALQSRLCGFRTSPSRECTCNILQVLRYIFKHWAFAATRGYQCCRPPLRPRKGKIILAYHPLYFLIIAAWNSYKR